MAYEKRNNTKKKKKIKETLFPTKNIKQTAV